ncbi:hypothetical protein [Sorangium cellulosum]|nr:hypothetical protein [Sorangium cellulosum]
MPLVWDLTTQLKTWLTPDMLRRLNNDPRHGSRRLPDETIDTLVRLLAHPELHYESILGNLEVQYIRQGGHGIARDYNRIYQWLIESIYHLLYYRHIKRVAPIRAGLRFFDGIIELAEQNRPLWVFSLNHDVLLECMAFEFGIPIESGFPGEIRLPRRDRQGHQIGELIANTISGEDFDKLKMPFLRLGAHGINLLKIHGALDMFTFRDGKDLLKLRPATKDAIGVIEALRMANEELVHIEPPPLKQPTKIINEIAYADADGEMQFLRRSLLSGAFKFSDRHSQTLPKKMLEYFRLHLYSVSRLIVVGCSLGDTHINNILRDWLETSQDRSIEIVGPGVRSMPTFLLHLAPQVILHDTTATDFFARFSKRPLSMREKALKAMQKASRDGWRRIRGHI